MCYIPFRGSENPNLGHWQLGMPKADPSQHHHTDPPHHILLTMPSAIPTKLINPTRERGTRDRICDMGSEDVGGITWKRLPSNFHTHPLSQGRGKKRKKIKEKRYPFQSKDVVRPKQPPLTHRPGCRDAVFFPGGKEGFCRLLYLIRNSSYLSAGEGSPAAAHSPTFLATKRLWDMQMAAASCLSFPTSKSG